MVNRGSATRFRAERTGEDPVTARQGVHRHGLGLDECTPAQHSLRTLLGQHLFNGGDKSALPYRSMVHVLTSYTLLMSPRYDRLVVITDAAPNVVGYLVPNGQARRPGPSSFIPGLRLEQVTGAHHADGPDYHLIHLPTGARMIVTEQTRTHFENRPSHGSRCPFGYEWWTSDVPVTAEEHDQVMDLVPPPAGVAAIVNALVVRMRARDPHHRWAMGNWWNDPLQRPGRPCDFHESSRRLMPGGRHWLLEWCGYPYASDVAAMLCEPRFGLPGAEVTPGSGHFTITLGGDALRVRNRHME
ncbi:hypothetical protein Ait01nite_085010 [Actinoplanes italicus]|uniref:Uncharacterized protein n=1 Tax=Actinoplanes italicus TaxID=113567 RepID=A0A2T0JXF3_9ACTN|nr:hypothetical protein [Actinoplanes italicus]PRX12687.1 hypothetical protein CLV67_127110 [Actinoplanes italicus]GIE35456.1 hypothetical protein Ait01nite_085010 [Actinoplanes italicus]